MNCFLCGAKLSKNRSPNVCVMCESDHFVERDDVDPLAVLRAIGEAVATVARARMIVSAAGVAEFVDHRAAAFYGMETPRELETFIDLTDWKFVNLYVKPATNRGLEVCVYRSGERDDDGETESVAIFSEGSPLDIAIAAVDCILCQYAALIEVRDRMEDQQ